MPVRVAVPLRVVKVSGALLVVAFSETTIVRMPGRSLSGRRRFRDDVA